MWVGYSGLSLSFIGILSRFNMHITQKLCSEPYKLMESHSSATLHYILHSAGAAWTEFFRIVGIFHNFTKILGRSKVSTE
uniref:Uncharacterized protein n=1 Tax=Engystomops pustulosus TaxID=76066 RepID=A0AAV6Z287_ENGPU|nr:hypothetical protein GDO81_029119 [Engystomops pustulosus]